MNKKILKRGVIGVSIGIVFGYLFATALNSTTWGIVIGIAFAVVFCNIDYDK